MAKVLIVGHPSSNYQTIEKLLHSYGMLPALPSKQTNMAASEIDATLIKSINKEVSSYPAVPVQLTIGSIWDSLAMDLFLGNIDQTLWGWSDSKAISLLNYWRDMDEDIHFVFTYTHPSSVLLHEITVESDEKFITQTIQEWINYNQTLLDFYKDNSERCLLVHSEQAIHSTKNYLNQVSDHIEASWQLLDIENINQDQKQLSALKNESNELCIGEKANSLTNFLADYLIQTFPQANKLYKELQSYANLPLNLEEKKTVSKRISAMAAWQSMLQQSYKYEQQLQEQQQAYLNQEQELIRRLNSEQEENSSLIRQLHTTQEDFEKLETIKNQILSLNEQQKAKLEDNQREIAQQKAKLEDNQREIAQQKAKLEESQQETIQQRVKLEESQREIAQKVENWKQEQVRLQNQLQEQNQRKEESQLEKQLNAYKEENLLILQQLHLVQEELERSLLEKKNKVENLRPIYYGAADRVRNYLSYQLGASMIKSSKSLGGWLMMPFSLLKVTKEFKKEQKKVTKKLPPLSSYQDYFEAERVKKHLSYKLGKTLLDNIKNPFCWVILPFKLLGTVREFRKQKL